MVTPQGERAEDAPLSSYDALLSSEPEVAPSTDVETPVVDETPAVTPPRVTPRFGLAPVGLAQVMRVRPRAAAEPAPAPVAVEPTPPATVESTPPSRLTVVREPVGADPSFGIPRVPQREPARPVAAPRPEPLPWRAAVTPSAPVTPEPMAAPVEDVVEVTPVLPEPPLELLAALAQAETEATPSVVDAIVEPTNETPVETTAESIVEETATEPVAEPSAPADVVTESEPVAEAHTFEAPSETVPVDETPEAPIVVEVVLDDADDDLGEPMLDLPVVEPVASEVTPIEPTLVSETPVIEESIVEPEVVATPEVVVTEPIVTEAVESDETVTASVAETSEVEHATHEPVASESSVGTAPESAPQETASEVAAPPARSPLWPSPQDLEVPETPIWRQPWLIAAVVAVLFGVGWWLGHQETRTPTSHASPLARALSAVGLGGAHFGLKVESDPPGAWIAIDGKDTGQRTPATFNLKPGLHRIRFSITDLGSYQAIITGSNGQDRILSESLHGTLEVRASNPGLPVRMALDGQDQGFLPVSLTKLPPGLHQMQFSGPDLQPWAQTVNVPVRGVARVEALPVITPATGVLQVQATLNDDAGAAPLKGASVYVDGELRGRTPLKLELARGPHSLRVTYDDERAPVQVIDLPGGNERFATFAFGIENDLPPLRLQGDYSRLTAAKPTNVSATLEGMALRDVREAHLHVKGADGLWRRLDMALAADARGVTVSAAFPVSLLRGQARTPWYLSVSSVQGDEFFTEIQRAGR